MYWVVGCGECSALWIVDGRPETTNCRRCGKRHRFEALRTFAETETSEAASRVRSAMLAERSDDGEFVDPTEIDIEAVGMDESDFLEQSGLDAEAIEDAGSDETRSRSRKQVVLDAVAELEEPTTGAVIEYADGAGVSRSYVERALDRLVRSGELLESEGVYRRL
ncbi:MAG: DUF5817 domain-containing protein [Natronomonas sp.]